MRKRKLLAVLLSTVLLTQTVIYAAAEQETGNAGETEQTQEFEQKSMDGEMTEAEDPAGGLTGGYLPSDLDYNTPVYYGSSRARRAAAAIPASYQSDVNALRSTYPAVRDQNPYGTCWAFSTMGLAEFDLLNKGAFTRETDLSELQLAYFTYNFVQDPLGGTAGDHARYYNENTATSYLDYGGNYAMAVRRLSQWIGAVKESDVPYSLAKSTLTDGLGDSYAYQYDAAHLENAWLINLKENAADVKQQIMKHGAVGTMYDHLYAGATYEGAGYSSTGPTAQYNAYYDTANTAQVGGSHAVMIVGWDDTFSKEHFLRGEKPDSDGAWLIRNSWGEGSYNFDYFWMSYETHSLADTAWVMDFSADDGYDNNYQLDGGVQTYRYTGEGSTTVANIFDVSQKHGVKSEMLEAVSLSFTEAADVEYTIDIYTDIQDSYSYKPVKGTKQEAASTHGRTAYAGVYTIPLEQPVELKPGSRFSVVVTTDKAAIDCESAVNVQSQEDWGSDKYVWECGVSYYDQYNYKSYYLRDDGYGYKPNPNNYCIKAFTKNRSYQITYELNGGTNHAENPETCGAEAIALKAPVKEGCVFEGWYLDADYQTGITEIPADTSSDYTLYAKWSSVTGEKLIGHSLSMKGDIEINYYMELPEELLEDKTAVLEFTRPDGTVKSIGVNEAEKTSSGYKISCPVAAKEMTDEIKMQVISGGQAGESYTYSVKEYAEYLLAHQEVDAYKKAADVVVSMLNYGAAAQEMFAYHQDLPANEKLSEEERAFDQNIDFRPYQYTLETDDSVTGITYYGSSLLLKSRTAVRDYFTLADGQTPDGYRFTVMIGSGAEQELEPKQVQTGGQNGCYVEIRNISAKNLDQKITVIVRKKDQPEAAGIRLNYGAFSYADAVSRMTEPDEKLVQVTKALYRYWEKARDYAENNK